LGEEQAKRSDERPAEDFTERFIRVVECSVESFVASFLTKFACLALKEGWCIGFLQEEETSNLDGGVGDAGRPERPTPSG